MTHDEICQFLDIVAGADAAAGYQGSLFGHASASAETALLAWPQEVLNDLPETERHEDTRLQLEAAARFWVGQLADSQLSMRLLLPDDGASLTERTDALCQWCQGFLVGLASGGVTNFDNLPGSVPEFVKDVLTISQATAVGDEGGSGDEEDETAFAELVEYLRVGTQLVYDELAALTPARTVQ